MASKRDLHEQWVMDRATHYTTCVFRGRGVFDTVEHKTLDAARAHAQTIDTDRGVMIYAVFGVHQGHVENVYPNRRTECTS
jgi:hypothetical protein